jgi:hypothetical protein
MAQES